MFNLFAFINNKNKIQNLTNYIAMIMLFLSGSIYPLSLFPGYFKYLFYINPMTYVVQLFRFSMTGTHELNMLVVLLLVAVLAVIVPMLGAFLYERRMRR